ncbi:unnamed protein product [Heligmosomoides polygyrus]|uniref:PDEase domain-containing protein n=1 Tax=Heligmosomoides polygyrus TaxID=6339 RepID=A0A3P7WJ53_HELPZ|nr:unnamed protein product [Heligmosomoides polygyrus]
MIGDGRIMEYWDEVLSRDFVTEYYAEITVQFKLKSYRARPDEQFCEKEKHPASHAASDYENIQQMNDYSDTMSSCTSEMSIAMSTESTLTLTEKETTPTPVNGTLTRTPVLRRRRSTAQATLRRNYRIVFGAGAEGETGTEHRGELHAISQDMRKPSSQHFSVPESSAAEGLQATEDIFGWV